MPKPGKDLLADVNQLQIDAMDEEKIFQQFNDDAFETNNIFIKAMAMDFPESVTPKKRNEFNDEWIARFPVLNHVKRLEVRQRVKQEFFDAICKMKNLESLNIWQSVAEDINEIKNLTKLRSLTLSNFSRVTDISAITKLTSLEHLTINASFKVSNYELLGNIKSLKSLTLGGDSIAPRKLMLQSLEPFTGLSQLEVLDLFDTSIRDKQYHHLLKLKKLKRLDASWRMTSKDRDYIQEKHPALSSGFFVAYDFVKNDFKEGIEWWLD